MNGLEIVERSYMRDDLPEFGPGDTVKVHYKVTEGGKDRIQMIQGTVLRIQRGGLGKTFTVRKLSFGVGVERTFPIHSPKIQKIEVLMVGKVRRAKLYYLRDRVGKKAKIKEKRNFNG